MKKEHDNTFKQDKPDSNQTEQTHPGKRSQTLKQHLNSNETGQLLAVLEKRKTIEQPLKKPETTKSLAKQLSNKLSRPLDLNG